MEREEIFQYVKEQYGTEPEYLWKKDPDSAVLRHKNGKWYAIIMAVEKKTLGLEEDGKINILDVKCDPDLVGMIIQTYGFLLQEYSEAPDSISSDFNPFSSYSVYFPF